VVRNGGCRAWRRINHRAVQPSVDDAHGEGRVDAAKGDAVASVGGVGDAMKAQAVGGG